MASYELDKLVMLLSADWFLPHWQVVGICTEEKDRLLLKEGFREIVRQIMSDGEQYWETDFSPERVRRTRAMLEALLKRCKLEQAAVSRINRLISGQEFPIDGGTRWLLVSMTEQLLDCLAADVPPLDSAIKEALRKEWGRWQDLSPDYS